MTEFLFNFLSFTEQTKIFLNNNCTIDKPLHPEIRKKSIDDQFKNYKAYISDFQNLINSLPTSEPNTVFLINQKNILQKIGQVIEPNGVLLKNYRPLLAERFKTNNSTTHVDLKEILDVCLLKGICNSSLSLNEGEKIFFNSDLDFLDEFWTEENVLRLTSIILFSKEILGSECDVKEEYKEVSDSETDSENIDDEMRLATQQINNLSFENYTELEFLNENKENEDPTERVSHPSKCSVATYDLGNFSNESLPKESIVIEAIKKPKTNTKAKKKNKIKIVINPSPESQTRTKQTEQKLTFDCSFKGCDKTFKRKSVFKRHLLSHAGVSSFTCERCGIKFKYKSSLHEHLKTSTTCGDKSENYKCSKCSVTFTRKHCWQKHERQIHSSQKLTFNCSFKGCDKAFGYKQNLDIHLLTHAGIFFTCERCRKKFKYKKSRDYHFKKKSKSCMKSYENRTVKSASSSKP